MSVIEISNHQVATDHSKCELFERQKYIIQSYPWFSDGGKIPFRLPQNVDQGKSCHMLTIFGGISFSRIVYSNI